ncbi:hypothetical protein HPB48_022904 [Haemaphysalis longicornis]|uniref:Transgelin n=1 Tax=Haemaphysalis longicornis TaxID=44386 RepID=A0A9J6H1R1_HAELO|nr:hypothetical protein HPB48_022904 [Haemaphysalis longicornis]
MNKLMPGCIPKINTSGGQFKLMENITHFQNAAKAWGVPEIDVFQTVDLWEKRNIPRSPKFRFSYYTRVHACIVLRVYHRCGFLLTVPCLVGAQCYTHPEYNGTPAWDPSPPRNRSSEWTQEQLRAGEGIINLQMGSNKGATQSGQNFGNTRHM